MPNYQGPTRNLTLEQIRNLTLEKEGVCLPSKPLFTPVQCEYIRRETEEFVKAREESLKDTGLDLPNIRNIFHLGGKPTVGFLVMQAMARYMAQEVLKTDKRNIVCSIDGIFFQKRDDSKTDSKTYHMNFHTDARLDRDHENVVQGLVQITPGEKNGSCFTTFLNSYKDVRATVSNPLDYSKEFNPLSPPDLERIKEKNGDPVVFDNDELPQGQVIFFHSDMVHSARHSSDSDRIVYYVTCWQRPTPARNTDINLLSNARKNIIPKAYINNRLTGHNLCQFDLQAVSFRQANAVNIKAIMKEKLLYYRHPDLDNDEMARLLGFESLSDLRQKRSNLSTGIVEKHFDNVQSQPKTMAIVREELYGNYNKLKRKLDHSNNNNDDQTTEIMPVTKKILLDQ